MDGARTASVPSSSFHSNSGKSVTQRNSSRDSSTSPSSRPRCKRRAPSTRATLSGSSAPKRTVVAGIAAEEGELVLGQELGDRRADLAFLVEHEIGQPLRPPLLGERLEPVELGPRELLRDADEAHGGRIGEDAELGVARELGRVLDLELEAQIGLVRAVAVVRLLPGDPAGTGAAAGHGRVPRSPRRQRPRSRPRRPRGRGTPSRRPAAGARTGGRRGDPRLAGRSRSGSSGRTRPPSGSA